MYSLFVGKLKEGSLLARYMSILRIMLKRLLKKQAKFKG
jgi:hypothetical protein